MGMCHVHVYNRDVLCVMHIVQVQNPFAKQSACGLQGKLCRGALGQVVRLRRRGTCAFKESYFFLTEVRY